jgi:hypothetical protein
MVAGMMEKAAQKGKAGFPARGFPCEKHEAAVASWFAAQTLRGEPCN